MRVETVTFEKLGDVKVLLVARETSVFVVWDSADAIRPAALSHGAFIEQLDHFTDAEGRLSAKRFGYVALLEGHSRKRANTMAAAIEQLLRDVARDANREPVGPAKRSATQRVCDFCAHGELHIDVVGFDPLASPKRARRLSAPKRISVRADAHSYEISHDWRERR